MKNHNYLLTFTLVVSGIVSTYLFTNHASTSAQQSAAQASPEVPADGIDEYQVGSVLYMQKAGEYRALAYQAFNLAARNLDEDFNKRNVKKLPKPERKKPRAIIVDVDETVLDNSPNQAYWIKNNMSFSQDGFTKWVHRQEALAIPGAVEFLQKAAGKGVKIFYVTNRKPVEKADTIANLQKLKFPDPSDETVMVQTGGSSKEERRNMIEKTNNYRVVLLIGDNLNDFSNVFETNSITDRFSAVEAARQSFGGRFIILPNSIYGDWENAIYKSAPDTSKDRRIIRHEALQSY